MEVKVCNFRSNEFSEDFVNSVVSTGFAVITHHGIDHGLIREAQDVWRAFFNQAQAYKDTFINHQDSNMGYTRRFGEQAVGAPQPDLKEFMHWKLGQMLPTETTVVSMKLFLMLEDLSNQILFILDRVKEGTTYRQACQGSDNTVFRALYYPALNDLEREEGMVRSAPHEDINFITLLVAASASGLQVKDNSGQWHDVPHEDNSITVNIGDMLQLASSRFFKSTTHRVINPSSSATDRISMPLFVHPYSSTMLAPGFTAQQYLDQRLSEIYKKVKG